jgi:CubicO group peptidase (beta-lactamase class C family)
MFYVHNIPTPVAAAISSPLAGDRRSEELKVATLPNPNACQIRIPGVPILGTAKADRLVGGRDNNYLNGYAGNDRLYGGGGNNRLFGGSGNDWLYGGNGSNRLYGGSGNDRLFGGNGKSRLDGGSGLDLLVGGGNGDFLIDRDGGDRLLGNGGNDVFWIGNGSLGATEIVDFQVGRDRLKLLDMNISYEKLQLQNRQNRVVVIYQGRTLAVLNGVKANLLTRDHFDFGNAKLARDLQTAIEQVVKTSGTPGGTAFVTLPDGTTWMGSTGVSNVQTRTAMKTGDRFNIASITKGFVATVVLQLVQEGKLNLNDTLDKWLPSIAQSIPNGRKITIKQLLAHTSGIPDFLRPGEPGLFADLVANPALGTQPWPLETILSRYIYGKPAKFMPGQGLYYSNTNYLLLGKVIERATQTSLAQQFQSRIFEPLGMKDTFYVNPIQVPGGTTHGYLDANDDGKIDLNDIDTTTANIFDIQNAAGGIISTASDVDRFAQALFDGELLSPDDVKQITSEQFSGEVGLGIGCGQLPDGEPVVGASGGGLGWSGKMYYLPRRRITIITMTNSNFLPTEPDRQMFFSLLEAIAKYSPSTTKGS